MENFTTTAPTKTETLTAQKTRLRAFRGNLADLNAADQRVLIGEMTSAAPAILKGTNRELAVDYVQMALLKYWEKPTAYNSDLKSFRGFIFDSARRLAIDCHRSKGETMSRRASVKLSETNKDGESVAYSLERHLIDGSKGANFAGAIEANEKLKAVAAKLTERQMMIFQLEAEGYSNKEIAEYLEIKDTTLRQDVFKARKALQAETGYGTKGTTKAAKAERQENKEFEPTYMNAKEIAQLEYEMA